MTTFTTIAIAAETMTGLVRPTPLKNELMALRKSPSTAPNISMR